MPDERRPPFSEAQIQGIAKAISDGLTGTEFEYALRVSRIDDISPGMTKWKRLFNALVNCQAASGAGNKVLQFIKTALAPARFIGERDKLERILARVNQVLAFAGLEFRDDGKFHRVTAATTLSEAERRASKLADAVSARALHNHLLDFCRAELLENNYFHAVLEATKAICARIRERTGLVSDGNGLVHEALDGDNPPLRVNALSTLSEKSEQAGFANLVRGVISMFRNPTAHVPRVEWDMSEADALDLFSVASLILRRIDSSK